MKRLSLVAILVTAGLFLVSRDLSAQINTDNVKSIQGFMIGGPDCPGCKGLLPTSPLILIDGLEVSSDVLAQLSPDNIKSFSVVNNASAALEMYGIRGVNGVLIITSNLSKKDLKKLVKKAKKHPNAIECQHSMAV